MTAPDLLNTDQVVDYYAQRFGVGRRTVVEKWMREPDFPAPAIYISRASRAWRRDDIEGWRTQGQRKRDAIESAVSL